MKIFASHRAEDGSPVRELKRAIESTSRGRIEVAISEDLSESRDWWAALKGYLEGAECLFLISGAPYEDWSWCLYEAGFFDGLARGRRSETPIYCVAHPNVDAPGPLSDPRMVTDNDRLIRDLIEIYRRNEVEYDPVELRQSITEAAKGLFRRVKITISYRREDSGSIVGRIVDRLVKHYGPDTVFRDIDSIPPGIDFRKYINEALGSADVLLAIIGPDWAGRTPDGRTRIAEPTDLVRIEVEAALRKDIPVVPVLVDKATMPQPSELPEALQNFAYRNAVKVDALEDFEGHVRRLIGSLDRLLQGAPKKVG